MTIVDGSGQIRKRELTMMRCNEKGEDKAFCGDQKYYIYFHRPVDVSKMAFLVHKHVEKDDDRWLFLPALNMIKRISAADKRTSFVGSNFYYEDISGRSITADNHELLETDENFYILKHTPKKTDSVEFYYYKSWIHKNTFLVIQLMFYDKQGKEYRVYKAEDYQKIDGYDTITKATMTDLRTNGHTTMELSKVEYDLDLDESLFSERYLKRPPYKYLLGK
jgi:outer membrane lipoprotein-sorting protein